MHKLTKLTRFQRKEIYENYKKRMRETKWKNKENFYKENGEIYRVHPNTIRKVCKRWRRLDFEAHKSTTRGNMWHNFKNYTKAERKILKKLKRKEIIRYEKKNAWELWHIDLHKMKNIKWQNPKKKKYVAWLEDDATRMTYCEVLPNKKAKTLACFLKRAYLWFKKKGIIIKRLLSDNGLEFTTHHVNSRPKHSFEIMLNKLKIKHKYTRVRRPQTNWKIERFWRIFEEQFFRKYTFTSWKEVNLAFRDWLVFYNNERKHGGIKNFTPMQKLDFLLKENLVCL